MGLGPGGYTIHKSIFGIYLTKGKKNLTHIMHCGRMVQYNFFSGPASSINPKLNSAL